jgi:hypothetical protein
MRWLTDLFYEEFEDTETAIRIRQSKEDRQHNGQKKKDKQRPIKHTHKTKDRVTRTPLYVTQDHILISKGARVAQ